MDKVQRGEEVNDGKLYIVLFALIISYPVPFVNMSTKIILIKYTNIYLIYCASYIVFNQ